MRCVRACLLIGILHCCPKHRTNAIRSFLPSITNNLQDSWLLCDEKLGTFCGDELVWQICSPGYCGYCVFFCGDGVRGHIWVRAFVSGCFRFTGTLFVFVLAGRIKKGFWRCALVSACLNRMLFPFLFAPQLQG